MAINEAAAAGYNRDAAVRSYQSARPSYHPEGVAELIRRLDGAEGVVELGAGTGILTRDLVAAGVAVTAIEPVAAMRDALTAELPAVECLDGTAERMSLPDQSVDAIIASQSFHWFDHGPALEEIHRVLRPGRPLLLIWNVRDNSVEWMTEYSKITDDPTGTTPRHHTMQWRRALETDERFDPLDDWAIDNPWPTTRQGVVDRALSISYVAAMAEAERASVAERVAALVEPTAEPFNFPYRTEINATRVAP